MSPDFESLPSLAEVVVRIGLNLQPGQPLLITDPYDLFGTHPEAIPLAAAIKSAAGPATTILTADPAQLRTIVEADDQQSYVAHVSSHVARLQEHLQQGGAFLFLTGTAPQLFAGLPIERLARFETVKWRLLGPIIQRLIRGATQWTLLPVPTTDWAALAGRPVPKLWEAVSSALRLGEKDPLLAWRVHLAGIGWQRDQLNANAHRRIRYAGPGTELTLALPRTHRWCTAQLTTHGGVHFVVNLPTEEIYTAPHLGSATGRLRVDRPITHGGVIMEDIELEFDAGRVVKAGARTGEEYLLKLLTTDRGARRIGEVALVPGKDKLPWAGESLHHILLDENAANHIALGDSYRFCSRAWLPLAINSSQLHLDLPLDAEVELS
jgi:aminopeptidase